MSVGVIQFHGAPARQIDRMLGRLPALDKAIQARYPSAQAEVGSIMTRLARQYVQVKSGAARGGIGHRVSGNRLRFGVYGVEHAASLEFGFRGRELVSEHDRIVDSLFGEKLGFPVIQRIGTYVRQQNRKGRPFLLRAYYDSFRPMFGILNRIIGEAQKEVGLDG
jgi:hypothetical protein